MNSTNNTALAALLERVSIPADMLVEPAPAGADLETIVQAGVSAPDHGGLRPWRFISIAGTARERLGEVFCEAARRAKPDVTEQELAGVRKKPLRAPLIVAVVAAVKSSPKIPEHEQVLSAGAAAQNVQLAANALGYGSIWLTGPFATDDYVLERLGLAPGERLVAFVYLGTPSPQAAMAQKKLQNRPRAADFIIDWNGEHSD